MANGRGMKTRNEYADGFGASLYADTPKAVFAAVAYSYAQRIAEDRPEAVLPEFLHEWAALHANGIIPQAPPSGAKARRGA